MDTVTIPKGEYDRMRRELSALKDSELYKRLLEFETNISKGKKFSRKDLGF